MKPNLILKSGRIVVRSPMTNGVSNAIMADGGGMSEAEWEEFCILVRDEQRTILLSKIPYVRDGK